MHEVAFCYSKAPDTSSHALIPLEIATRSRIIPAVRILCGGAWFGTPIDAVKYLKIALFCGNPEESASEEGLIRGFGLPFNIEPPANPHVRKPIWL